MTGARPGESGVVVVVPEAEEAVGALRARWDRSAAAGVPAHVTLLYPFVPSDAIDGAVVRRLGEALAPFRAFPFSLTRTSRFGDGVLYLVPEPEAPFAAMSAAVAGAFPDHPPYRGEHAVVVPHLTVADRPGAPLDVLSTVVGRRLPIDARATSVALLAEDPDGRWRTRHVFALRAA